MHTLDTTTLEISKLKAHPLQAKFFSSCTPADNETLAADLATNGQREPVQIMPPRNAAGLPGYTILDGHRRVRLMEANGEISVLVLVRNDLKTADADQVESEFLKFNFLRRQLPPLDRAAIALRQYEIELGVAPGGIRHSSNERAARQKIAEQCGWTARHLQRMFRILLCPPEIRQAVRDGHLRMNVAERIEALDVTVQHEIARRIAEAESPDAIPQIVGEYVRVQPAVRPRRIQPIVESGMRGLEVFRRNLADRLPDGVYPPYLEPHLDLLRSAAELIVKLEANAAQPVADFSELLADGDSTDE